MPEDVVAKCMHKVDQMEGLMLTWKAMSRGYLVACEDQYDDDAPADALLIFSRCRSRRCRTRSLSWGHPFFGVLR